MMPFYIRYAIGLVGIGCYVWREISIEERYKQMKKQIDKKIFGEKVENFTGIVWDEFDCKWINAERSGVQARWSDFENKWIRNRHSPIVRWNESTNQWEHEPEIDIMIRTCVSEEIDKRTKKVEK